MPVTRVATAQRSTAVLTTGSGDFDTTLTVPADAGPYVYAIAAFGITSESNLSSCTFGITLDGDVGTELTPTPLWFDSSKSMLYGVIFEAPSSGELLASFTGLPVSVFAKSLFLVGGVWSQTEPLNLADLDVVTAAGSGAVATSGVTVPSGVPADRVIAAHLLGTYREATAYNHTQIASARRQGGHLLLGEARGAASVASTVTHDESTNEWAAFGINLSAAPLEAGFSSVTDLAPVSRLGGEVYRLTIPHPDRNWVVPGIATSDPLARSTDIAVNSDGVALPRWRKDPDDTLDYTLHWDNHLADDDEIVSLECSTAGGYLNLISEATDGFMTQFWVSGGRVGLPSPVRIRWSTKRGRRQDWTIYITGVNN